MHQTRAVVAPDTAVRGSDLDARILHFIAARDASEADFEALALALFAYQFEENGAYRRYCRRLDLTPASVSRWQQIPPIPAAAFGEVRLACFPPERAAVTFVSSGTTTGGLQPSHHELENTALYEASLAAHFRACVQPDREHVRMLLLAPSPSEAPQSSLSYMLGKISETFGTADDRFAICHGELDFEGVCEALKHVKEPMLIFGTAFAFVHLIDRADARGLRFELPLGSRVVETGGFKGRSRVVARDELYDSLTRAFGVPPAACFSEYGMCELGSQWYRGGRSDRFVGPHWARTLVLDPVTVQPQRCGELGLLAHYDLSNRGSVLAVLTGDLGRDADGGFELHGRFSGAPPKGCSMAVDAMLTGT